MAVVGTNVGRVYSGGLEKGFMDPLLASTIQNKLAMKQQSKALQSKSISELNKNIRKDVLDFYEDYDISDGDTINNEFNKWVDETVELAGSGIDYATSRHPKAKELRKQKAYIVRLNAASKQKKEYIKANNKLISDHPDGYFSPESLLKFKKLRDGDIAEQFKSGETFSPLERKTELLNLTTFTHDLVSKYPNLTLNKKDVDSVVTDVMESDQWDEISKSLQYSYEARTEGMGGEQLKEELERNASENGRSYLAQILAERIERQLDKADTPAMGFDAEVSDWVKDHVSTYDGQTSDKNLETKLTSFLRSRLEYDDRMRRELVKRGVFGSEKFGDKRNIDEGVEFFTRKAMLEMKKAYKAPDKSDEKRARSIKQFGDFWGDLSSTDTVKNQYAANWLKETYLNNKIATDVEVKTDESGVKSLYIYPTKVGASMISSMMGEAENIEIAPLGGEAGEAIKIPITELGKPQVQSWFTKNLKLKEYLPPSNLSKQQSTAAASEDLEDLME